MRLKVHGGYPCSPPPGPLLPPTGRSRNAMRLAGTRTILTSVGLARE